MSSCNFKAESQSQNEREHGPYWQSQKVYIWYEASVSRNTKQRMAMFNVCSKTYSKTFH